MPDAEALLIKAQQQPVRPVHSGASSLLRFFRGNGYNPLVLVDFDAIMSLFHGARRLVSLLNVDQHFGGLVELLSVGYDSIGALPKFRTTNTRRRTCSRTSL